MEDRRAARFASTSLQHPHVSKPQPNIKQTSRKSTRKRGHIDSDESGMEEVDHTSKRAKIEVEPGTTFKQPSLVTGATLKDYQLAGVEWMIGLDSNGASGILGKLIKVQFISMY